MSEADFAIGCGSAAAPTAVAAQRLQRKLCGAAMFAFILPSALGVRPKPVGVSSLSSRRGALTHRALTHRAARVRMMAAAPPSPSPPSLGDDDAREGKVEGVGAMEFQVEDEDGGQEVKKKGRHFVVRKSVQEGVRDAVNDVVEEGRVGMGGEGKVGKKQKVEENEVGDLNVGNEVKEEGVDAGEETVVKKVEKEVEAKAVVEVDADAKTVDAKVVDAKVVDAETLDATTVDGKTVDVKAADAKEADAKSSTSVKMSAEQVAAAEKKRETAARVAEKQKAADDAKVVKVLDKAEEILTAVGSKTGVFELGARAREGLEAKLDEASAVDLDKVEKEKATQAKIAAGAANALRKVSSVASEKWEAGVVPRLQEAIVKKLPEGQGKRFGVKAISSAVVTAICGVVLLPLFLGGGGAPEKTKKVKKIAQETTSLEKKLASKQRGNEVGEKSAVSGKADITSPFPADSETPKTVASSRAKSKTSFKTTRPQQPAEAEAPAAASSAPSSSSGGSLSSAASSVATGAATGAATATGAAATATGTAASLVGAAASKAPAPVATPAPGVTATASAPAPAPVPAPAAPEKPVSVTEAMAVGSIKTSLGSRSSYVVAGSFDTLAVEPTVVVEVTRAFNGLSAADKRSFADVALRSSRSMGYEAISIVETGTESELVHGGIDIDLEDETANLRAQLRSVQRQADKLATSNAGAESQLEAAQERLEEERVKFASEKVQLQNQLKVARGEVSSIGDELREAKNELAELPDRLALEKRTEAAENDARKMSDTIEVLGRQVTVARDAEQAAKAMASKSESFAAEADRRITAATADATKIADAKITENKAQSDAALNEAKSKLVNLEQSSAKAADVASKNYAEIKDSSERTLAETVQAKDAEIKTIEKETEKTIQAKYEALLSDMQKKANAELDRYNAEAKASAKTLGETQRAAEKAESKLERDNLALARKVDQVQAKLKAAVAKSTGRTVTTEAETPLAAEQSSTAPEQTGSTQ